MILSTLERRYSLENPNVPIAEGFTLLNLFGGQNTVTGKVVTADVALNASAVWSAVNVIAGTVGSLPIKLYRRRDDGGKEEERGHWVAGFCRDGPNEYMVAGSYREAAQGHLLLRGNTFTELIREGSRVVGARLLHPDMVKLRNTRGGYIWTHEEQGVPRPILWEDMLHIAGLGGDGILGWSVLKAARESIALGLAAEEYSARFYSNNARPSGFLSVPEVLKAESKENLVKSWNAAQGGLTNAHKVAVLEGGITWQQMSLSAEDSQMLQSRQFQLREIARWFNIPPHKIGDLDDATFSNISEQQIQFMQDTMEPWLVRWEQAVNSRLLTEEERNAGLFVEYLRDARMVGDPEKRGNFYTAQVNVGAMTPNEIRAKENRNPVPGGDKAFIRMDMIPLDQLDAMTVDERQTLLLASHGIHVEPKRETRAVERRGYQKRYQLRTRFRSNFLEASERLVRGEIRDLSRKLGLLDEPVRFADWLEDYYFNAFPEFATRTMGPVFDLYGQTVADAAAQEIGLDEPTDDIGRHLSLFTEGFIKRHARSSRKQLISLSKEPEPRQAVEERITAWDEGAQGESRASQVADNETVLEGESVARAVWLAGGILTLRWLAISDSCPYCRRMNGSVAGILSNFVDRGQAVTSDQGELVPSVNIPHPPLHRGCDCLIVPS